MSESTIIQAIRPFRWIKRATRNVVMGLSALQSSIRLTWTGHEIKNITLEYEDSTLKFDAEYRCSCGCPFHSIEDGADRCAGCGAMFCEPKSPEQ